MAYSPYESQNEPSQGLNISPAGAVGEYFKLKYLQWPGTWSGSRGIATPFGIHPTRDSLSKYFDSVKKAYKGYYNPTTGHTVQGSFRSALSAARSNFGAMAKAGGGRVFGYDEYSGKLAKATDHLRRVKAGEFVPKNFVKAKSRILKTKNIVSGPAGQYQFIFEHTDMPNFMSAGRSMDARFNSISSIDKEILAVNEKISKFQTNLVGKSKNRVTRLASQKGWRTAAKWGIRGMKAASVVGAGLMAIDIGLMIGEPIGRLLVNEATRLGDRIQNRFMPEMGKLSAAYLSYGAATERQRAVQSISKGYINGRSAYGQESFYMHS